MNAWVWILHDKGEVLLTDEPGLPTYEGRPVEFAGVFELPDTGGGWGEASGFAERVAARLGYEMDYHSMMVEVE